jgi:hypothetical protein
MLLTRNMNERSQDSSVNTEPDTLYPLTCSLFNDAVSIFHYRLHRIE